MALLSVNAAENADGHVPARTEALSAALTALPQGRPVTIMIHGYRFCPGSPEHDPHRHILSLTPRRDCWKAVSWPRHLHLDRPGSGLGIGFGWPARGTLPRVAERAFEAGRSLGRLIDAIHRMRPDVPVHVVAHSLGARVALEALDTAPPGVIRRMILMSGAEYRSAAERALSLPAASRIHVLNVTSGENAAFDAMFRIAVGPLNPFDRALSSGLGHLPGCTDLPIDDAQARAALLRMGHRLRAPATRICHWSGYMRPGLFGVYRRLLDLSDPSFPDTLTKTLAQTGSQTGERDLVFPRVNLRPAIASWGRRSQV